MTFTLQHKVIRNLRDKGALKTLTLVIPYLNAMRPSVRRRNHENRSFDARHGTDTGGIIAPAELNIANPHVRAQTTKYEATPVWLLKRIFASLPIRKEDYVLMDIGSGKGRTLLVAADYPFKKIIGIEISPELNAIAATNLERHEIASERNCEITTLCANAARIDLPREKLVIYLYNPFQQGPLASLLANIESSLRQYPRRLFIVYTNPVHHTLLDQSGFLRLMRKTRRYRIYVSDYSGQ